MHEEFAVFKNWFFEEFLNMLWKPQKSKNNFFKIKIRRKFEYLINVRYAELAYQRVEFLNFSDRGDEM